MNFEDLSRIFNRSISNARKKDRVNEEKCDEVKKCKEYLLNFEALLENISQIPIETWEYLEYVDESLISLIQDDICMCLTAKLASQADVNVVFPFLTMFLNSFSTNLPDFNNEDFINILIEYSQCSDASLAAYSIEVMSIISRVQEEFKESLLEHGIIEILSSSICVSEEAQSSLHLLHSLGPFEGLITFAEAVLSYHETLTKDVLIELENFISPGNEEIFTEYDQIFNVRSEDSDLIRTCLILLQKMLKDPLASCYVKTREFYSYISEISESNPDLNSEVLMCMVYACLDSPSRIEIGIESGVIDFISEQLENGSFQDGVISCVLITAMLASADVTDAETLLESGLLIAVFSHYDDYEHIFSFILENIQRSIDNESESEGTQIQEYIRDNEEIWSVLDDIAGNELPYSEIAQKILEEIAE